ncbi:hypothetical protein [Gilliamella sp. wkB178]|uniref:hypothetical protein n=1 Tax=Gilliamella sp. wkB178 TaxID=3120259 RepID=UPI0009C03604|nr:hypothetical protein [Gilliamella apicola]
MNNMMDVLSEYIEISPQYQRSIRIDHDLENINSIEGFICHKTTTTIIENILNQLQYTNQGAYTWTGPFGSGKSSLALMFATILGKDNDLRTKARAKFSKEFLKSFDKVFSTKNGGWDTLPLVGKRESIVQSLITIIKRKYPNENIPQNINQSALIELLLKISNNEKQDGILLIIDELGKFLEFSITNGDDIYFLQELAEAASRSKGKFIVIGLLHQSFRNYAYQLDEKQKNEWSKIQGRYADIPLIINTDEVVSLIGKAIKAKKRPNETIDVCNRVANVIKKYKPFINKKELANQLNECWPLHPVMAMLLGPISRKQIGQNERSIFTFLSSCEPFGFQYYLQRTTFNSNCWYRTDNYWDYLRANLESVITYSNDSHRWAQAVDIVEKVEGYAKVNEDLKLALVKTIALINLFKNSSGLTSETEILEALYPEYSSSSIIKALSELADLKVIIYRKHINSWVIFEGSDFDIDQAIRKVSTNVEEFNLNNLNKNIELPTIIAKKHYYRTGSMRRMNVKLIYFDHFSHLCKKSAAIENEDYFGTFYLVLPNRDNFGELQSKLLELSKNLDQKTIIGYPSNYRKIISFGEELALLFRVKDDNNGILESDAIARRELFSREQTIELKLQEELSTALYNATWCISGEEYSNLNLNVFASNLADKFFNKTPIIRSELINRNKLSPSISKARKELLYRIFNNLNEENLGFEKYPPERGLYDIVLKSTKLHSKDKTHNWEIISPSKDNSLYALWNATDKLFSSQKDKISVKDIYHFWSLPPFGLANGIKPILFWCYYLSNKDHLSLYKNNMFLPNITDLEVDELLQDESIFSIRKVILDKDKRDLLKGISDLLQKFNVLNTKNTPLDAARGLVGLIYKLPEWAKRTNKISLRAKNIRNSLLKACDPYKILFNDLRVEISSSENYLLELEDTIQEIISIYPNTLNSINEMVLKQLEIKDRKELHDRAKILRGISSDYRFNAFIDRLSRLDDSLESIEAMISLVLNKPSKEWNDADLDELELQLIQLVTKFKQYETFASIKNRKSNRLAIAVVSGAGKEANPRMVELHISVKEIESAKKAVKKTVSSLLDTGLSREVLLAAFTEIGIDMVEKSNG